MAAAIPPTRAPPVDPRAAIALLQGELARILPADGSTWLAQEIERQAVGPDERRLAIALGLTGRKLQRLDLPWRAESLAAAQALRPAWQPQFWSTDEAARVVLLLAAHRGDDHAFSARLDRLCVTAEITEHVSYMKGLAIFPAAGRLLARAREGVRSSIAPVFEAVACRNPYPRDYFDTDAWNQMVVKCVFGGTPLAAIVGLRERRNPELILMLRDLVAERQAAARPLPPEVHRFIAG